MDGTTSGAVENHKRARFAWANKQDREFTERVMAKVLTSPALFDDEKLPLIIDAAIKSARDERERLADNG